MPKVAQSRSPRGLRGLGCCSHRKVAISCSKATAAIGFSRLINVTRRTCGTGLKAAHLRVKHDSDPAPDLEHGDPHIYCDPHDLQEPDDQQDHHGSCLSARRPFFFESTTNSQISPFI